MLIPFSGKMTLNFSINLILYFFINLILTFTLNEDISVGYRVKSNNGILFRKWATKVLKDYMIKKSNILKGE